MRRAPTDAREVFELTAIEIRILQEGEKPLPILTSDPGLDSAPTVFYARTTNTTAA